MHKATKEAHEDNWIKQAAEAMDIDLDSDMEYAVLFSASRAFPRSSHLASPAPPSPQVLGRGSEWEKITQATQGKGCESKGA